MATEINLRKRRLAAVALLGGLLPTRAMPSGSTSSYPDRPIILTVGYPAGGGADTLARLFGDYLADDLGQKVVVQNRPGAAGNIAAESVAHAKPDGHTLYISTRSNTIHKSMYGYFNFDVARDLMPIGLLAKVPNVLVARVQSSIATFADLTALARAQPGRLTYASTGVGSDTHLLGELLQRQAQIELLHVPYRGGAAAMTDVIGGRVDLLFFSLPGALPYIKSGSVRAIALMSPRRAPAIEDIPTMAESGVFNVDLETWFGLMAPAGTSPRMIARLNEAVNRVLKKPGLHRALAARGYDLPLQLNTSVMS